MEQEREKRREKQENVKSRKERGSKRMQEKESEGMQEEACERIYMLTQEDECYPERLREIPDPPKQLYVRGKLPKEEIPAVAVIGARECSEYGRTVAAMLGNFFGENGIQVISGMARGIDGIGQTAALDAGGSSFAVLGSGVDVCYPAGNRTLYDRLAVQGGILSEYAPGTPALARNFPPRNRIVSGLADAVIVVEAREKSGTLITVDMALEQGKEVYAVPGRVTDALSSGCNRLLRLGAAPLPEPEGLLEELWRTCIRRGRSGACVPGKTADGFTESRGKGRKKQKTAETFFPEGRPVLSEKQQEFLRTNPAPAAVYGCLELTPRSVDVIREILPEAYGGEQLPVLLMRLCMEGLAQQAAPGQFCRAQG